MNAEKKPQSKICDIVILGGGTAAWMTANILAHSFKDLTIKLVESPDIATVGVGEGSTPALKAFFDLLDIDESKWMFASDATYKNGIEFENWSIKQGYEQYFHPFPSTIDNHTLPIFMYNARVRCSGTDIDVNPSDYFLAAKLADENRIPIGDENFPFDINYAYHFDSGKLGKFLKSIALEKGVLHQLNNIVEVKTSMSGEIAALVTDAGEIISGKFFIDCSGFKSELLRKTLNVPFVSYKDLLFNDSAVLMQTPAESNTIESKTTSTALSCGWKWRIPLKSRHGHGYVYSSSHITDAAAEKELRASVGQAFDGVPTKLLKFELGRVEKHWHKNCLAVGLSQGFIEPLEATALMLIQQTVGKFVDLWKKGNLTDQYQNEFNRQINAEFDGIRDYIVLHYKLNSRDDSQYWRDNRSGFDGIPERLKVLVNVWQKGGDFTKAIKELKLDAHYPVASWYVLFAGYGFFPNKLHALNTQTVKFPPTKISTFIARCVPNYQPQVRNNI